MKIHQRTGTHVSRYFESLRINQGLKPSELAYSLGAKNILKIGNVIRQFELTGDISFYWFQRIITFLNPEKDELQKLIKLDQNSKVAEFNKWADEVIEPYLTIRYLPGFYGTKEVPKAFTSSRKDAEEWCSKELKGLRAKGYLNWTRKDQTVFEKGGLNPRQFEASFEQPPYAAWMKVSGSPKKFIFKVD